MLSILTLNISQFIFFLIFMLFLLCINFYWNTVALQCFVSFFCTAKLITYMFTYIPSFLEWLPI